MTDKLKIGSALYGQMGYSYGAPRERHYIVGETKGLWEVAVKKRGSLLSHLVNKKTLMERDGRGKGDPRQWYTERGHRDAEYIELHKAGIERSMIGCSADQLRAIAAITGYGMPL